MAKKLNVERGRNVFHLDPDFEHHEAAWAAAARELLGEDASDDDDDNGSSSSDGSDSDSDAELPPPPPTQVCAAFGRGMTNRHPPVLAPAFS